MSTRGGEGRRRRRRSCALMRSAVSSHSHCVCRVIIFSLACSFLFPPLILPPFFFLLLLSTREQTFRKPLTAFNCKLDAWCPCPSSRASTVCIPPPILPLAPVLSLSPSPCRPLPPTRDCLRIPFHNQHALRVILKYWLCRDAPGEGLRQ